MNDRHSHFLLFLLSFSALLSCATASSSITVCPTTCVPDTGSTEPPAECAQIDTTDRLGQCMAMGASGQYGRVFCEGGQGIVAWYMSASCQQLDRITYQKQGVCAQGVVVQCGTETMAVHGNVTYGSPYVERRQCDASDCAGDTCQTSRFLTGQCASGSIFGRCYLSETDRVVLDEVVFSQETCPAGDQSLVKKVRLTDKCEPSGSGYASYGCGSTNAAPAAVSPGGVQLLLVALVSFAFVSLSQQQ